MLHLCEHKHVFLSFCFFLCFERSSSALISVRPRALLRTGTCFVNPGNGVTGGFPRPSSCSAKRCLLKQTRRGRACSDESMRGRGGYLLHSPDLRESSLKFSLERAGLRTTMFHLNLFYHQLEDLEVTVADHIQRVLKPNFGAAWDEVGDEYEKEETFTLSAIKTLEGKAVSEPSRALNIPPSRQSPEAQSGSL